jgi:hypothetical protein
MSEQQVEAAAPVEAPITFAEYLERFMAKWPDIVRDHSFDAHLMEHFSEWPNFTEWRCCNGKPCRRPGLCKGRDPTNEWRKLARKIEQRLKPVPAH